MSEDPGKTAEEFLSALADRITQLIGLAEIPKRNPEEINFDDYRQFRDMMAECLTFLIVIERRISDADEPKRTELLDKFDELTVGIWSTLLDGSLGFLKVIAQKENLPIGTKHVFVQELKTLHDAEQVLKQDRFSGRVTDGVNTRRTTAEKILNQIIERAPQLLDLSRTGSAPS